MQILDMNRVLCLYAAVFFQITSFAQVDKSNLNFEQLNTYNGEPAAWQKTYFRKRTYKMELDSVDKVEGKFSLKITYDTIGNKLFDGQVVNIIPVDVIGEKIKISFKSKILNEGDTARVNFVLSQEQADINTVNRSLPIKSTLWENYEVEFDMKLLKSPIAKLRINSNITTQGGYLLDDFKIIVDGKNILEIQPFSSSKNEIVLKTTTVQKQNLKILCKVWGVLKYFHPTVANGKYNWDMELFKMIPKVKSAKNKIEVNNLFVKWIDGLGEVPKCDSCNKPLSADCVMYNKDDKWLRDTNFITKELSQKLVFVLENRFVGKGYYASIEKNVVPNFYNENSYNWRGMNYPNELFRLQFLFRYWNTIQYFFPYKNIIGEDWNNILQRSIPLFNEAKDSLEYHIAIAVLINSINDSHANFKSEILSKEYAKLFLPVQIKIFNDNDVVVFENYNDSLALLSNLKKGDKIISINGENTRDIIQRNLALINGSNYPTKLRNLIYANMIAGGKDSLVKLVIERDNKIILLDIKRYYYYIFNYKPKTDSIKWKILDNNIGYINMGLLKNEDIDSMMNVFKNTNGLVIDLRNYPNRTVYKLGAYFYDSLTMFAKLLKPNKNYLGTYTWFEQSFVGNDGKNKLVFHYKNKYCVLVNEKTQSQSEFVTMALQKNENCITIGSQTAGADGNVANLILPGNVNTGITGLGIFYPNGDSTQRVGVKIDIEVKPTLKGLLNNRDEVLGKALQILKK